MKRSDENIAATRRYGYYCALARALDQVGQRWTLLIVRELSAGSARFAQLRRVLPGIGATVLSARLEELQSNGLVETHDGYYHLTERGLALQPALDALAIWGLDLMEDVGEDQVELHWLRLGLPALAVHRNKSLNASIELRASGQAFHVDLHDGTLHTEDGHAPAPDAVIQGPVTKLVGLATGRTALDEPLIRVLGDNDVVNEFVRALRESLNQPATSTG